MTSLQVAAVFGGAYAFTVSYLLLKLIGAFFTLHIPHAKRQAGLDASVHGETVRLTSTVSSTITIRSRISIIRPGKPVYETHAKRQAGLDASVHGGTVSTTAFAGWNRCPTRVYGRG
jgi:4-hydroxybenzoate polyprenyltransferase